MNPFNSVNFFSIWRSDGALPFVFPLMNNPISFPQDIWNRIPETVEKNFVVPCTTLSNRNSEVFRHVLCELAEAKTNSSSLNIIF